jgi:phage host-nuclease inhibitor protein Gam
MTTTAPDVPLSDEELLLGGLAPECAPPPEDTCEDLLVDLPPERRAAFAVVDEDTATWVVDKLLAMDERNARYEAQMKAKLAAMQKDRERFAGRFVPQLQAWAEAHRPDAANPKGAKYLDLDAGRIGFRKAPARAKVVDEKATIAYLRDVGELAERLARPDEYNPMEILGFVDGRPGFETLALVVGSIVGPAQREEGGSAEAVEEALAFLRESINASLADFVREEVVHKLAGDAVRAHALATGETLPGVEIAPETETFYFQAPAKTKRPA